MTANTDELMDTETKLKRIAELSRGNPGIVFNNLMHLFNAESLRGCYQELDGRKALGVDGISKDEYGVKLEANIEDLLVRMKRMGYRPGAVRQVLIPKEGKPKATRPLGISNFEDKIFQKMMQKILESIYEPRFKSCSYGFRPNMGCHTAIKALSNYLYQNRISTVIDVDIANYFGSINRSMLLEMLRLRISDEKFIRYVARMFKAGVLADGELRMTDEGVQQGSVCSPVLANIFAHHVMDEWFEQEIRMQYGAEMFRYADDVVIVCREPWHADPIKEALEKRLAEYSLKLNKDKTKLVAFSKEKASLGIQQGSFGFLGFTWYLGRSRKGHVIPKVKSNGKRIHAKLKKVNQWAREARKLKVKEMWKVCCAKLTGHINYYGVSFNSKQIRRFRDKVMRIMFKWINRRSQRSAMTWDEFALFMKLHPLPEATVRVSLF